MTITCVIDGLFVGKAKNYWPDRPPSAIGKNRIDGVLKVGFYGFDEDEQADLKVHGGREKALHHYAYDHMADWQVLYPEKSTQFDAGCFGENISSSGFNEELLCLGDILSLGSARVQICQARQPCWKLNMHMGIENLAGDFIKMKRTGWYYRVLEEGHVCAGDRMELLERLHPDWPLKRLISARYDPELDPLLAIELCEKPALSEAWRKSFRRKADL